MKFEQQSLEQYFPKTPYPLQLDIAHQLYAALEDNRTKLFIFQSPTGTGKTYSLLCPLLYWLARHRGNIRKKQQPSKQSKFPSWLKKSNEHKGEKLLLQREKAISEMITLQQMVKLKKFKRSQVKEKQKQEGQLAKINKSIEEIQVQSEEDQNQAINGKRSTKNQQKIIEKQLKVDNENVLPKIIFISRTHSQLAQVVESLKLILQKQRSLKYMQVASKQHLCINRTINEQKNNINQKCQRLLDHSKCSYFHQMEIKDFFNKTLQQTMELGQAYNLCPYYASRNILEMADLLCLPYSSILKRDIRNRLSINIHNSIIVFDQGHNLLQTEKQINSSQIRVDEMEILAQQTDEYLKKYQDRLRIKNYRLMTHLLEILRGFIVAASEMLSKSRKDEPQAKKYVRLNYIDFLLKLGLKQMKIHAIMKYFQLNNIDKKLAYFNSANNNQSKGKEQFVKNIISVATVNQIMSFLYQFCVFDQNKQILLLKWIQNKKGSLKIMCFQSGQIQEIILKSKMTVIAGGTMEPLDELLSRTVAWKDKTVIKKCSHIIRGQQCKIYIIKRNNKKDIIFNHQSLSDISALQIFKPICTQLVQKVIKNTEKGGGIVVFIQNYQLIAFFKNIFKNQPYSDCIIYDSKEQSTDSQNKDIFNKYKSLVQANLNKNYILFSVMGGKLSQGINFSDRLARSIVVLGLPYSNMYAAEIAETMTYYDKKSTAQFTGKKYYQNLCIKTLNQTIGRGIRHINDYANIYLCDYRFDDIKMKLSSWMRDRIELIGELSNWL